MLYDSQSDFTYCYIFNNNTLSVAVVIESSLQAMLPHNTDAYVVIILPFSDLFKNFSSRENFAECLQLLPHGLHALHIQICAGEGAAGGYALAGVKLNGGNFHAAL